MKKRNLFITALLVVAATTVAMVSCKKDNQDVLLNNTQSIKAFTPPVVDDMNAYLKNFKQKMKESQNAKDAEWLSLEEAAWHLSSVANYDFANANVEFTDLRYDTIYEQVTITNGQIALSELNSVYQRIATDIDNFYQNLNLDNKHFRFIGVTILENGNVMAIITSTYTLLDHVWYFPNIFYADSICDMLFSEDSVYVWDGLAMTELNRILNLFEHHSTESTERWYYIQTRSNTFNFQDYTDPYGSPFAINSRLYSWGTNNYNLTVSQMCYALDSYLELGYDYLEDNPSHLLERPICWTVTCDDGDFGYHWWSYFHILNVNYGICIAQNDSIQY